MENRVRDSEAEDYATSLDYTLKELQRKVKEHETELAKIRSTHGDAVPSSPELQANVIKAALVEVTNSEPFLPFPGSVLPALVALRKTHQVIEESKAYLASQRLEAERARKQLDSERVTLKDHRLLTDALKDRIRSLRLALASQAKLPEKNGSKNKADELEARKKSYNAETFKLMKSLLRFIDHRLAAMLAAEELGGPIVGDMVDVDPEDLAGGFNAHGKAKKAKGNVVDQDKRQRRLDEIWGAAQGDDEVGRERNNDDEHDDEAKAAGREMRSLTEELLNKLAKAEGDNSGSYVQLTRESAAVRFLVRSKVAQFHPKDATKLRLIDFGRELDD
ncbi:hypothetical protein DCS_07533 [Drechmeria coniospora]|uniref:Centromere protein Cenp-K n=1 Tax=Drechmeria coniospora TaxID=98403 RepID=A0A151GEP6_DRECN|nr:hypothetical protein DCS_07533 [Drechmeria coniospora]KYK55570.1 hypothetical protein DCS_07533 [Drechmeria coniospora]ODA81822.1 hypothetical protein RJ55_00327 [Drechmeria coniospora]